MGGAPLLLALAAVSIDYGYRPDGAGGLEYIVQVPPEMLNQTREVESVIDPAIRGKVSRIVVQLGTGPLPRDHGGLLNQPTPAAGRDTVRGAVVPAVGEPGNVEDTAPMPIPMLNDPRSQIASVQKPQGDAAASSSLPASSLPNSSLPSSPLQIPPPGGLPSTDPNAGATFSAPPATSSGGASALGNNTLRLPSTSPEVPPALKNAAEQVASAARSSIEPVTNQAIKSAQDLSQAAADRLGSPSGTNAATNSASNIRSSSVSLPTAPPPAMASSASTLAPPASPYPTTSLSTSGLGQTNSAKAADASKLVNNPQTGFGYSAPTAPAVSGRNDQGWQDPATARVQPSTSPTYNDSAYSGQYSAPASNYNTAAAAGNYGTDPYNTGSSSYDRSFAGSTAASYPNSYGNSLLPDNGINANAGYSYPATDSGTRQRDAYDPQARDYNQGQYASGQYAGSQYNNQYAGGQYAGTNTQFPYATPDAARGAATSQGRYNQTQGSAFSNGNLLANNTLQTNSTTSPTTPILPNSVVPGDVLTPPSLGGGFNGNALTNAGLANANYGAGYPYNTAGYGKVGRQPLSHRFLDGLLLFSLIINVYLLIAISRLITRHRDLVTSVRGTALS